MQIVALSAFNITQYNVRDLEFESQINLTIQP